MSAPGGSSRPCDVQLCPALALDHSHFCVAHRTAKKLAQVKDNERCRACSRVLHVGDYVTLLSTSGDNYHAACPEKRQRVTSRPLADTPLFDGAVEGFEHVADVIGPATR